MRADVLLSRGRSATRLVCAELDEPRPEEVLVRVEAVGVCHTDVSTRHLLGETSAVLGHEGCGVVERTGSAVVDLEVGDRVVMSFRFCGSCGQCDAGQPAYCREMTTLNYTGRRTDGSPTIRVEGEPVFGSFFGQSSFASHAVVAASACVKVGDVDPVVAAPLGCGFLTGAGAVLNVLRPGERDRVLVVGAGGVGSAAMLTALSQGADVVVADPVAERRELAEALGATAVPSIADAGRGFSHALDTTGRPDVIAATLRCLDTRGALALVGLGPAVSEIDVRDLMLRGLRLLGCVEGDAVPRRLVPELLRRHALGTLPFERLLTTYPLGELDQALEDQRAGRVLKPVLVPSTAARLTQPEAPQALAYSGPSNGTR